LRAFSSPDEVLKSLYSNPAKILKEDISLPGTSSSGLNVLGKVNGLPRFGKKGNPSHFGQGQCRRILVG
jgi:hypothetical protein